jgi:glutaminyl-tRNA synthetase
VKDASGKAVELICAYDPLTRGGDSPDGRKVKGTIHWVSAAHAVQADALLLEPLFLSESPAAATGDPLDDLNSASVEQLAGCQLEPALADATADAPVQFERMGYFVRDNRGGPGFIRTIGLRDGWAKAQAKA